VKLEIKNVLCSYGAKKIVDGLSFDVESGDIVCLLGPNGVGKTTLFKTMLGFLKLRSGEINLDGRSLFALSQKERAIKIGYVPQSHTPPFPFSVLQVVLMGRTAHLGLYASPSKKDTEVAEMALEELGISFLRDRVYTEISGGERQMVLIARALVQEPEVLFMDEPTSNLDFGNQIRVLNQIRRLAASGLGIVMTTHFPDHAFLCSSKVVLMQRGYLYKYGTAEEIITEKNLRSAYGIDVCITDTTAGKSCVPVLFA
jgi:iron complex transport system ATP-binding protein